MATYGFPLAPQGLKPVVRQGSAQVSFSTQTAYINIATARSIGNNEVVQLGVENPGFINAPAATTVPNPAANQQLNSYGVLAGIRYKITQFPGEIRSLYWASGTVIAPGTQIVAQIIHDPSMEYEIQVNSVIGLQQTQVGSYCNIGNVNFIDGSVNGTGPAGISQGQSTAVLDLTTISATPIAGNGGLFDVEIVGLSQRPQNFFGTVGVPQPYNYAIVKFNSFRQ